MESGGFGLRGFSRGSGKLGFTVSMLSPRFSTKSYEPHPNLTVGVLGLGPEGAPSEIKFRSLSKKTWKSVPGWSFRANSGQFEHRGAFSI